MYQVLYRKWRPTSFSDVYGQPQVTVTLKNELKSNRISHAYLFTGSRGTGKTTCAKILAKAVNCLNLHDGEPCNECENCRGIDSERILDVVEMDAASNNGVEDIRDLREEVRYTPVSAKYRVMIIDEAHMLSNSAFNALLKTLEEPPGHVIFILATTEVHKLPATIVSRCQRFDFKRISPEDISLRLKFVAKEEKCTLTDDAAMLIARLSDGGMRDALSLLDQCMGRSKDVDESIVRETAGTVGREHLFEISDAAANADIPKILSLIDNLHSSSKDMTRLTEELIVHFRDILIFKASADESLISLTSGERELLKQSAGKMTLEFLLNCVDVLTQTIEKMAKGSNKRVELEIALFKITAPELNVSIASLLKRIETLELAVRSGIRMNTSVNIPDSNTQNASPKKISQQVPDCRDALAIENWPEVLNFLKKSCISLYSALIESKGYKKDNFIFVDAAATGLALLRESSLKEYLREAIREVLGLSCSLGPYKPLSDNQTNNPLQELKENALEAGIPME